jgi:hypothetical protein
MKYNFGDGQVEDENPHLALASAKSIPVPAGWYQGAGMVFSGGEDGCRCVLLYHCPGSIMIIFG